MSRINLEFSKLINWLLILGLVLPQVSAATSLPPSQQESAEQTQGVNMARTKSVLVGLTLVIEPGILSPEMLQVPAGETVTFRNDDSVTRTIILQPEGGSSYEVYLPLVVSQSNSNPSAAPAFVEPAVTVAKDRIVLAPGASAQRTFTEPGNILVIDADDETQTAILLVIPPPQPKSGPVLGRIIDYGTKLPIAGAQVSTLDQAFNTLTDVNGEFSLPLPPGEYVIALFANGYTFANRKLTIRPFTPVTVDTIELVPLDGNVTPIDSSGGTAENGSGSTNVLFASGAVTSTKAIRLTDLPVDEFGPDWAALPGPFPNGSLPLGFVMFEPDGTNFEADAVWTIEYDGNLPVGTYVPCYYWIENEARWGEPVDGFVIDLGGGQKALQATLPHFSSYGFWAPPPPDPLPPVLSEDTQPPDLDEPNGPDDNPNESDQDQCIGSKLNLASGELCQTVGTVALPNLGGMPSQITARYYSKDVNHQARVKVNFEVAPGSAAPLSAEWRFSVAGRSFSDSGLNVDIQWDGRDNRGLMQAPGRYIGKMTGQFNFIVASAGGNGSTFPQQGCVSGDCGISVQTNDIPWPVSLVRNDLSPFGIGWFSPYDTLLVDAGDWVTINQGDGRQAVFTHLGAGTYDSPPGDNSTLIQNGDGSWTRTFSDGSNLEFSADGRLSRLADRNGNFQQLLYENNGQVIPPGEWGLTTRIRRIEDNSGNTFDYDYDPGGWLSSITDNIGRIYSLEHDDDGYLTAFVNPLGQRQEYSYDERGMMTAHTDRRGFSTTYDLDDEGRVITRTWPTGTSLTASYTESETSVSTDNGSPIVTTLDQYGNAIAQYNGVFTVRMTYDDNLRPTGNSRPNAFVMYDAEGQIIESISDVRAVYERSGPYNQVSRMTSSNGLHNQYGYDDQGNLQSITDVLGQSYQITYDSHGQPLTITDPLGNVSSYTYDSRGQILTATDGLSRTWQLSYDAAGNLISAIDPRNNKNSMTYDQLNRLTEIIDALGGSTEQEFDANGNLTRFMDPSGRATEYSYDALNRLTKITYPDTGFDQISYDANGNPTSIVDPRGIETTYAYDAANRPLTIKVDSNDVYDYAYDDVGQPISTTLDAQDGTGLSTAVNYIDGISGYPLYESQIASGIPLTTEVDYAYGGLPYMRDLGHPVSLPTPDQLVTDYVQKNEITLPPAPATAAALSCDSYVPTVISQTTTLETGSGVVCFGESGSTTTTLIEPGITLTVEPGVSLAGWVQSTLEVQGTLIMSGTVSTPTLLTAQNNANTTTNYEVEVTNNGRIEMYHTEQWYGGVQQLHFSGDSSGLILSSHLGLGSTNRLVRVDDQASLEIHDSSLGQEEVLIALGTLNVDSTGTLSVTNSLIFNLGLQSNIKSKGVRVNDRNVAGILNGGNTFVPSENQPAWVYVTATGGEGLIEDTVWMGLDKSPGLYGLYFYFSYMNVTNGATLTVKGPQDIQPWYSWNAGNGSTQIGHIRLEGQPGKEVRIARPSSVFRGLIAQQNSSIYADHAIIGYSTLNGNINVHGGSATILNSQIINGEQYGILSYHHIYGNDLLVENSLIAHNGSDGIRGNYLVVSATIHNTAFIGNGGMAINNTRPQDVTYDARYNFWGSASGPQHSGNLGGSGGAVSDGVDYYPWLATPGNSHLSGIRLVSNSNPAQSTSFLTDALGRVVGFENRGYAEFEASYTYDPLDRLVARQPEYGLPITDTFGYDAAGQLTRLHVATAAQNVLSQTLEYDDNGNITRIISAGDGVVDYTYDAINRLTSVNGWGLSATYDYDAAGNRTQAGAVTFSYDAGGRLVSSSDGVSYGYDAAGNLTTRTEGGQTTSFTWDGRGLLTRIDYHDGTYSAYRYDDAGRRISRRLPDGSTQYYVYTGDMLAQELDDAGAVVASYTYDGLDRPVSMWRDGNTYFYVLDQLGSVQAMVDISGTVVSTYEYDPWGNIVSETGSVDNPMRFAGREYDLESGLYYNRFRYYDPQVGRFISRDQLGLLGGTNAYAYAKNNPLLYRDEYGLKIKIVFEIFSNARRTGIDSLGKMRNIMRGLRLQRPQGEPLQIWTNADKNTAQNLGRLTGKIECVDEGLPYIKVKNKYGQDIAEIIFKRETVLGLAATLAPLSGLGVLSDAVQGNSGPLLDTMDMLLGMLMPGLMTVDPSVITPGTGGIPQA